MTATLIRKQLNGFVAAYVDKDDAVPLVAALRKYGMRACIRPSGRVLGDDYDEEDRGRPTTWCIWVRHDKVETAREFLRGFKIVFSVRADLGAFADGLTYAVQLRARTERGKLGATSFGRLPALKA